MPATGLMHAGVPEDREVLDSYRDSLRARLEPVFHLYIRVVVAMEEFFFL